MSILLEDILTIRSSEKELKLFGYLFGVLSVLAGIYCIWHYQMYALYFFGGATLFAGCAKLYPKALLPFYKIWMGAAIIIGFFVSHIILIALFYCIVTPTGILMRLMGKDLLQLQYNRDARSYWMKRDESRQSPGSADQQY